MHASPLLAPRFLQGGFYVATLRQERGSIAFVVDARYRSMRVTAKGAYSYVAVGKDALTGAQVAVKRVALVPGTISEEYRRLLREVELGAHIAATRPTRALLPLLAAYVACTQCVGPCEAKGQSHEEALYTLWPAWYADVQTMVKQRVVLEDSHHRYFLVQMLMAVNALHKMGWLHRDLKPANLLWDGDSCRLAVCDYNLARPRPPETETGGEEGRLRDDDDAPEPRITGYVTTRWYRAPEMLDAIARRRAGLVPADAYGPPADIWAVGCIFAQLLHPTGDVPWRGKSSADQRQLQCATFEGGTPPLSAAAWARYFPTVSEQPLELLSRLLTPDPAQRITAEEALVHPFLRDYAGSLQEVEEEEGYTLPSKPFLPPVSPLLTDATTEDEARVALLKYVNQLSRVGA